MSGLLTFSNVMMIMKKLKSNEKLIDELGRPAALKIWKSEVVAKKLNIKDTPANRIKLQQIMLKGMKAEKKSRKIKITSQQVLDLPSAKDLKASDIAASLRKYNKQANASPMLGASAATPQGALRFIRKEMKGK